MLICVIAAYNEEETIGRAVTSAFEAGCDFVHVFDGGWDGFGDGDSTDMTIDLAHFTGAITHEPFRGVKTQAEKRTRMFQHCGAWDGDHVLSLDADETLDGTFPVLERTHYTLTLQNDVENDLPGVRGIFPAGDGGLTPFPLLRLFSWNSTLACVRGGVWYDHGEWIAPYNPDLTSRLPVCPVTIRHWAGERPAERIKAKADFYREDHKRR